MSVFIAISSFPRSAWECSPDALRPAHYGTQSVPGAFPRRAWERGVNNPHFQATFLNLREYSCHLPQLISYTSSYSSPSFLTGISMINADPEEDSSNNLIIPSNSETISLTTDNPSPIPLCFVVKKGMQVSPLSELGIQWILEINPANPVNPP